MAASPRTSNTALQSGRMVPMASPNRPRAGLSACLVLLVLDCEDAVRHKPAPESGKRFGSSFVGNSLTYVNDLPGMVVALAARSGDTVIQSSVSFPNYSLEDHWNDGRAVQEISREAGTSSYFNRDPLHCPPAEWSWF